MAINPALLIASSALSNSEASIGGPTTPAHWWFKRVVFTNTDSATHAITVYRVPSGGTAATGNILIPALNLSPSGQPGATYVASELTDMILNPGDTIHAFADSASKVNVTASGFTF